MAIHAEEGRSVRNSFVRSMNVSGNSRRITSLVLRKSVSTLNRRFPQRPLDFGSLHLFVWSCTGASSEGELSAVVTAKSLPTPHQTSPADRQIGRAQRRRSART